MHTSAHIWNIWDKQNLVWLKKLLGQWQIADLKLRSFLSFPFYQAQRSYEKIMCICLLFYCFSGENGIIRSSYPRHFIKGVFKNFVKLTGKHLCQNVFLINLQVLLTSLLVILTCKNVSLFFLIQDNFMFKIKSLFFSFNFSY